MSTRSTMTVLAGLAAFWCLGARPASAEADAPHASAQAAPAASEAQPKQEDVPVVDEMPVPVKTVPPVYPESARKRHQEGTVYVQANVSKSGNVGRVKVAEGKGVAQDLDKAAVDAVRQWRFTPAKLKGKPVPCWVVIPVAFRLH